MRLPRMSGVSKLPSANTFSRSVLEERWTYMVDHQWPLSGSLFQDVKLYNIPAHYVHRQNIASLSDGDRKIPLMGPLLCWKVEECEFLREETTRGKRSTSDSVEAQKRSKLRSRATDNFLGDTPRDDARGMCHRQNTENRFPLYERETKGMTWISDMNTSQ